MSLVSTRKYLYEAYTANCICQQMVFPFVFIMSYSSLRDHHVHSIDSHAHVGSKRVIKYWKIRCWQGDKKHKNYNTYLGN